jgi:hypothetical protein
MSNRRPTTGNSETQPGPKTEPAPLWTPLPDGGVCFNRPFRDAAEQQRPGPKSKRIDLRRKARQR